MGREKAKKLHNLKLLRSKRVRIFKEIRRTDDVVKINACLLGF